MNEKQYWEAFCDELVIMSEIDQELKEGLAWIDKTFNDGGKKSFYEAVWQVIMTNPKGYNTDDFMKNLTRKPKNE